MNKNQTSSGTLAYDVVLVTRNRPAVLGVSIPLILRQGRRPNRLILVDASDDHAAIVRTVQQIFSREAPGVELVTVHAPAGTASQRNAGLGLVRSDVVFFPDDDSLWFPDYADVVMRLYERDVAELIGGVGGTEASSPPPELDTSAVPYAMNSRDQMMLRFDRPLKRLELFRFMHEPAFQEGREKSAGKPRPEWLDDAHARVHGPMAGFTMSFRTRAVQGKLFDEAMGRYALFEDFDVSLRVMEKQVLVRADDAKVFHYKSPEQRTVGFEWGAINILNQTYVICKVARRGALSRRNLLPYSLYKCLRYLAQARSRYGRDRFRGALTALKYVRSLQRAPLEQLTSAYVAARRECLAQAPRDAA